MTGSSDWGIRLHQLSEWGFDFSSRRLSNSEGQEDRASFVRGKKTIEPEHPNGLEFVTAKQCCRDGMHHSRMASIGQGTEDGVNEDAGMGAGSRCYVCSHRGHKELVRSLWLGENVVLSGSYDHTIKVSFDVPVRDRQEGLRAAFFTTDLGSQDGCITKRPSQLACGASVQRCWRPDKGREHGSGSGKQIPGDWHAFILQMSDQFWFLAPAANHHLGLWVWFGYQFCRNVIVVTAFSCLNV